MHPITKQSKSSHTKSKATSTQVKDLRPTKDAKAGGQKKEGPTTSSDPLNPGIS